MKKKFSELAEILGNDGDNIIAIVSFKDETAPKGEHLLSLLHGKKRDIIRNVANAYEQEPYIHEILRTGIIASVVASDRAKRAAENNKTDN